jgi:AbrB family looped-hinge helix DNA binding protein
MGAIRAKIGEGGRIVIPANIRRAMGVGVGDELLLRVEDGELRAATRRAALKKAQAIVRRFVPEGVLLSDELIADRRREAAVE